MTKKKFIQKRGRFNIVSGKDTKLVELPEKLAKSVESLGRATRNLITFIQILSYLKNKINKNILALIVDHEARDELDEMRIAKNEVKIRKYSLAFD